MALDIASLPRDPDAPIGIIVELHDENGQLRGMLERAKRALYGARSERMLDDEAQLPLGLGDVSSTPIEPAAEAAEPRLRGPTPRRRAVRNIGGLPRHLPREDLVIEPAVDACPCCGGKLHPIGEGPRDRGRRPRKPEDSEMLDIVPAILRVKRIHRPRYGCRSCEQAVVQAPAPPVCQRGYAASVRAEMPAGLRAHVYRRYSFGRDDHRFVIDHRVPPSLGGADTASSMWPEPKDGPMNPHVQDGLEDLLHGRVC